jgi:hypothetical protein
MSEEKHNEILTGISKEEATPLFIHYCSLFGCDVVVDGDRLLCTNYHHYEDALSVVCVKENKIEMNFVRGTSLSGYLDARRFITHCFKAKQMQDILPFEQVRIRSALLDADEIDVTPGTETVLLQQVLQMATKNQSEQGRYEGLIYLAGLSSQDNIRSFMVNMIDKFVVLFETLRSENVHQKRCVVAIFANLLDDASFRNTVVSWLHSNHVGSFLNDLILNQQQCNGSAQLIRECNRVLAFL